MRFTRKAAALTAAGGVAALVTGVITASGGVGAVFHEAASASTGINVATLACQLGTTDPGHVTITTTNSTNDTATIALGTITSSQPGSASAPVQVKNTGTTPLVAIWSLTGSDAASPFTVTKTPDAVTVAPGQTAAPSTPGFSWTELGNTNEGESVSAQYQIDCQDTVIPPQGMTLLARDGGVATFDGSAVHVTLNDEPNVSGNLAVGGQYVDPGDGSVPASSPGFAVANNTNMTVYMIVRLVDQNGNSHLVEGTPGATGMTWSDITKGDPAVSSWADVTNLASANGWTVAKVWAQGLIDSPASGGASVTFTCLQYNGTTFYGSGC